MRKTSLPVQILSTTLVASLILLSPGIEPYRAWAGGAMESAAEGSVGADSPAFAILPAVQASLQQMNPAAYGAIAVGGIDVGAVLSNIQSAGNSAHGVQAAQLISQSLASDPASLQSFAAAPPAEKQSRVAQAAAELSVKNPDFASAYAPAARNAVQGAPEAITKTVSEGVKSWNRSVAETAPPIAAEQADASARHPALPLSQPKAPAAPMIPAAPAAPQAQRPASLRDKAAKAKTLLKGMAITAAALYSGNAYARPDGDFSPVSPDVGLGVAIALGVVGLIGGGLYAMYHFIQKQDEADLTRWAKEKWEAKSQSEIEAGVADAEAAALTTPVAPPEPPKPPRDVLKEPLLEDVAGQTQAKEEIEILLDYLQHPEAYSALGARGYKGILFYGPPGTGKTMFAQAIANEAKLPIVITKGSEFIDRYVGQGAHNVREKFQEARMKALDNKSPVLFYIDEIDAVGGKRVDDGNDKEHSQTLNELLSQVDGFDKDSLFPIILMASTNRPDMLDPALVRGGRFEMQIPVGLPDIEGRIAILKVHSASKPLAADVDLRTIARATAGLSGADLAALINDAAMKAGRRRAKEISMADMVAAVDLKTTGKARKLAISPKERYVIAYHESGHALVSHLLPDADPVRKVTIVPHGLNALGFMQAMPEEESFIQGENWLKDRMAVALGGRVAEEMVTGQKYSGAQNDLESATRIARFIVMKFGMSKEIGHVAYDMEGTQPASGRALSAEKNRVIEEEIKRLLDEATQRAKDVLTANRGALDALAKELMEKETLRNEDMERLIASNGKAPASGGAPTQR